MQGVEIVADNGYGSEENYEYMFSNGMVPCVKYNMFHVMQWRKCINNPFRVLQPILQSTGGFPCMPDGVENEICPSGKALYRKRLRAGRQHIQVDKTQGLSVKRTMTRVKAQQADRRELHS